MKKGFTMVELLAVIIVLAILSLVAIPKLLKVVDTSKEASAENSTKGYIHSLEEKLIADQFDAPLIKNGAYYIDDEKILNMNTKGELPTEGWVVIKDGEVTEAELLFGKVVVEYDGTKPKANTEKVTPDDIPVAD